MKLPFDLSELQIIPSEPASYTRNPGGIRTIKATPGHFLTVKATTRILMHKEARLLRSTLQSMAGNAYQQIELPIASSPLGSALGNPKIKTIDANDSRRLIINGWTLGQIEALSPGDYVSFAGHKKVYSVQECAVVAGDGSAELILENPLLRPVSVGEILQVRPLFCLSLEGKLPEILEGNNRPRTYSFTLGEVWWY